MGLNITYMLNTNRRNSLNMLLLISFNILFLIVYHILFCTLSQFYRIKKDPLNGIDFKFLKLYIAINILLTLEINPQTVMSYTLISLQFRFIDDRCWYGRADVLQ